jgi:hypothetical protein
MSSTRRLVSVSALAALLLLTATMASHAAGPWPSVVGGGSTVNSKFSFSANEGPSSARGGFGSAGHAKIDDSTNGTRLQGPVICATINLTTQQGWFVFQYTDAGGNIGQARAYGKDVSDFAGGGDMFGWDNNPLTATCTQNPSDLTLHPTFLTEPGNTSVVMKGNIVIDNE